MGVHDRPHRCLSIRAINYAPADASVFELPCLMKPTVIPKARTQPTAPARHASRMALRAVQCNTP